jgi:hypothetical protein
MYSTKKPKPCGVVWKVARNVCVCVVCLGTEFEARCVAMVAQWSLHTHTQCEQWSSGRLKVVVKYMKIDAKIDCSRRPMEMAMAIAMTLAEIEYWAGRDRT